MSRGKKKNKIIYQGRNKFHRLENPSRVPVPMCLCGDACKMEYDSDSDQEETYMRRFWMCPNYKYEPLSQMPKSGWLTPPPLCEFRQWIDMEVPPEYKAQRESYRKWVTEFQEEANRRRQERALQKECQEEEERRRLAALEEERQRKLECARQNRAAMEENPDATRKGKWPQCTQ